MRLKLKKKRFDFCTKQEVGYSNNSMPKINNVEILSLTFRHGSETIQIGV